ncbi:hypothetical protein SALBM217S_08454 [Streptomyces griseoloalbus]
MTRSGSPVQPPASTPNAFCVRSTMASSEKIAFQTMATETLAPIRDGA